MSSAVTAQAANPLDAAQAGYDNPSLFGVSAAYSPLRLPEQSAVFLA